MLAINYISAIKNIFFPCLCAYCKKKIPKNYLCRECKEKIILLYPPRCPYCFRKLFHYRITPCKRCSKKIIYYSNLISITAYQEPMPTLIHSFKYHNLDYLKNLFSQLMISHLTKIGFNGSNYDGIVPVPLHKHQLKARGYNQSLLLAKLLSNYFKIPLSDDIISVTEFRPSQTKFKRQKRQKNVEGIFRIAKELKNRNIILIDDVFTTGATINSCSQVLKENGAKIITVITLSKTITNNENTQNPHN